MIYWAIAEAEEREEEKRLEWMSPLLVKKSVRRGRSRVAEVVN